MNIVVIGGTGLIGTKLVDSLSKSGHKVLAASPSTGVDTITREGLASALDGADVVVDVTNPPVWEDQAVLDFFETSTRNLLAAEAAAGVKNHVVLSIVGSDKLPSNGYFRAKVSQENIIKDSAQPYTILRATQFFEFSDIIAYGGTNGEEIFLSPALYQPIAADDVVATLEDIAISSPVNGTVDLAGPEAFPMDDLIRRYLKAKGDNRVVIPDVRAKYFGSEIDDRSLTPGENAFFGSTHFDEWLSKQQA
jgi:uncharacterized protein YbjT (DUF2867 family)